MRFIAKHARFAALFITVVVLTLTGCGGGGGGNNNPAPPPSPSTWTITLQSCTGVTFTQGSSLSVQDGGTANITGTFDNTNYQNLSVTGMSGTLNLSGTSFTYMVPAVHGNGTIVATDSPVVPPTQNVTATFTSGAGTQFSVSSATIQQGGSGSITLTLSAGYMNPQVVASDGVTSVTCTSTTDPTKWNVAFGPMQNNCTFTSSATLIAPQTVTATFQAGTGTTWANLSQTLNVGQSSTNTLTLATGYNTPVVKASDNVTPVTVTATSDPTKWSVAYGPVTTAVTFTSSATLIAPQTVTATFQAGTGTTWANLSQTLNVGQSSTNTLTLATGYNTPVVKASDNVTPVTVTATSDPTKWSVAYGPVTTAVTFTSSATQSYVVVPKTTGEEVVYVVSPTVNGDTQTMQLLKQRAADVTAKLGWTATYFTAFTTPMDIRNFLMLHRATVKAAIFVGNDIPVVTRISDDPAVTGKWCTTDQYYRSLDWPYADPTLDADGTWHIAGLFTLASRYYELPTFVPSFATAHIIGLSSATQLADIRGYLVKLNAHADDLSYYPNGVHTIASVEDLGVLPVSDIQNAWASHALATPGGYALDTWDKNPALQMEVDFVQALLTARYVRLQAHSSGPQIVFQGTDSPSGTINPLASTVVSNTDRARLVEFSSCFSGDYAQNNVAAACTVLAGDTLLAKTATFDSVGSSNQEIIDSLAHCYAYGIGRTPAATAGVGIKGEWETFIGDPTIIMQSVDTTKPQPIMVIDGKQFEEEFTLPIAVPSTNSYGIVVQNIGNADLVVNIDMFPQYKTAANANGMPHYQLVCPGTSAPTTNIYTVRIPAGSSQTLTVLFTQTLYGDTVHGSQRAVFLGTCNDPNVGAFRIDATETMQ